jgi:sulfhydrogenase subunit beta (sulfur reductase)
MIGYKILKKEKVPQFLSGLIDSGRILMAPVKKGDKYYFSHFNQLKEITDDYRFTELSPKSALFPRCEELINYNFEEKSVKINDSKLPAQEVVVYGIHPCDASAMDYLNEFFTKENPDKHFQERHDKTVLISLSCPESDENCFCTSVGGGPGSSKGSDLVFTDMKNGDIYIEIVTDKGNSLVESAKSLFNDSKQIDKEPFLAKVSEKFNLNTVTEKLAEFYDNPLWVEESLACLGCGACAFSCPTCSCFDIQDENNPATGVRLRNWDTCAIGLFTIHTSGHNPRSVQTNRWRHRIFHKFKYSVDNLDLISCVGCGRCLRICPAGMNILETVKCIEEL